MGIHLLSRSRCPDILVNAPVARAIISKVRRRREELAEKRSWLRSTNWPINQAPGLLSNAHHTASRIIGSAAGIYIVSGLFFDLEQSIQRNAHFFFLSFSGGLLGKRASPLDQ